jgi:hypothetical protein
MYRRKATHIAGISPTDEDKKRIEFIVARAGRAEGCSGIGAQGDF